MGRYELNHHGSWAITRISVQRHHVRPMFRPYGLLNVRSMRWMFPVSDESVLQLGDNDTVIICICNRTKARWVRWIYKLRINLMANNTTWRLYSFYLPSLPLHCVFQPLTLSYNIVIIIICTFDDECRRLVCEPYFRRTMSSRTRIRQVYKLSDHIQRQLTGKFTRILLP